MKHLAKAALAVISAIASGSAQLAPGQYQAVLTALSRRQLAGRATYTRCGDLLHIWLADTLTPRLSMEFGTYVGTLGPQRFRIAPIEVLGPGPRRPQPGASGYFRVFVPPDTLLLADSGELHLTGVEARQVAGEIHVAVTEAWSGRSQLAGSVGGGFRAIRDTMHERAIYRGARCDRPGAEWPRVEGGE